jgi:hypothetical protein
MTDLTPAMQVVMLTLYDVATHEGGQIILKNRYHSPAARLVVRGLVVKTDRFPYRPGYELTPAGIEFMQKEPTP